MYNAKYLQPQVSTKGLFAHYKMWDGLMIAGDNVNLVTNGIFAAWAGDNPTGWLIIGEIGTDPEISEVDAGQGHGGTNTTGGYCNIYTSDGSVIQIYREITVVIGRKYRVSLNINKVVEGDIKVECNDNIEWPLKTYGTTGIKTFTFVASRINFNFILGRKYDGGACDITIDDVSVKLIDEIFDYTSSGKGGTLVDTDTPKTLVPTYPGFNLTPTNDYISIDDHADFSPGDGTPGSGTPFSISTWVNMHNASNFPIASKGVKDTDGEWTLYVSFGKKIYFRQYDESVDNCYIGRQYDTSIAVCENKWTNIVATSDGGILSSGIKIYINSVRADDVDNQSNVGSYVAVENLTHDVWIGRYEDTYANGLFDDMMFFNRVLGDTEVKSIYSVTRQRYGV